MAGGLSGVVGSIVAWQVGNEQPPLVGGVVLESVRLRPETAHAFPLDPMARVAELSVAEQIKARKLAPEFGLELEFGQPARGPRCDAFTLTSVPQGETRVHWSPHSWGEPSARCSVHVAWQRAPGVVRASSELEQSQRLTLVVAGNSPLFADFKATGVLGKIPTEGLIDPPELLKRLFNLNFMTGLGGLQLSLLGDLSIASVNVVAANGGAPRFDVRFAGGTLRGGKLGNNDLAPRSYHLVVRTFCTGFGSVFVILMGVLGFLVNSGWDPCAHCGQRRKSPKADAEQGS